MSVKKRKGSPFYWYDFTVNGNRFRGSCETNDPELAKAREAKLRNDAWLSAHLGIKPSMTLNAALGRYWLEHGQYLRSKHTVKGQAEHFVDYFGKEKMLNQIIDNDIAVWKAGRRKTIAPATINRHLALLSKVKNMAVTWGMDGGTSIRKHMMPEPEARTTWISRKQAIGLISAAAPHLRPCIEFALLTGCRLSNIIELTWGQVDLHEGKIRLIVKSSRPGRKAHEIDISAPLHLLLVKQSPQPNGHVFTYNGNPIGKFRRSFKTACKNAGLKDFRFHDLRHTAASWMVQEGVPLDVIQKVLGHADISMTQKYAHRENTAQKEAMEALAKAQLRHTVKRKAN